MYCSVCVCVPLQCVRANKYFSSEPTSHISSVRFLMNELFTALSASRASFASKLSLSPGVSALNMKHYYLIQIAQEQNCNSSQIALCCRPSLKKGHSAHHLCRLVCGVIVCVVQDAGQEESSPLETVKHFTDISLVLYRTWSLLQYNAMWHLHTVESRSISTQSFCISRPLQ